MRTVGKILKEARLNKQISLQQVENATKIRATFLRALEANDFQKLPSLTSGRGFLKNYAEFLGLSPGPILAIFRRDFTQPDHLKNESLHPINQPKFNWTPKMTLISFLVLFFLGLLSWLGYQYFSLIKAPSLVVFSPIDGQQVTTEKIEVVGRADPDVLVTVNNQSVFLSEQGDFRYKLELFPGENIIAIEAKSKLGKKTKEERVVFYN